ncbi:RnfABCDGE type electron transport complex subunit G [Fusibacter ferrireducens]|uniref:Ion-translocating oxidoreductase complex subunit G n=1 Tax=Fusibacter ferrireducens TaxID=2785058 RepID=A0ABR9ZWK9_9FIRM|nr:RnfABCDGE type electron transport complex subunit G [Fusibacter ferrireducens]MBF4694857.1 RnfABCDGE type electron transport complex subunit G [Fusibacter ferrireducens]
MKDIFKTGIILFIICAVAAFALAMTNEGTKDQIALQRQLANDAAKAAVLPSASSFEDLDEAQNAEVSEKFAPVAEGYIGYDADHNIVGYVFKSLPTGFGGAVEVVTGIDVEGTVTGMRMGNHQETPGLGARAKEPLFYEQYNGMSASDHIGVAKSNPTETDIQAITGATISSAAITSGVNASIDAYHFIMGN